MAWGAKGGRGVDDLVERLTCDDPSLTSLHVFASRKFGIEVRPNVDFADQACNIACSMQRRGFSNFLIFSGSAETVPGAARKYHTKRAVCKWPSFNPTDSWYAWCYAGCQYLVGLYLPRR